MSAATDLAALLAGPPRNGSFHLVAVDGRGGSGKTTLAAYLRPRLPGFTVLNGDDFFEPVTGELAFGDFNDARFHAEVVVPLQRAQGFVLRPYDWATQSYGHTPVAPERGVLIERCYAMELDLPWDLTVWVDTPVAVCLERGLARQPDPSARAYLRQVWEEVWIPREDAYLGRADPRSRADLVLDGLRPFEEQVSV
jgi:uridine kinase